MSRHPTVKWAQRSDKIYISIDLPDAKDVSHQLEPEGRFVFFATKDGISYEVDITLFDKINAKESKCNIGLRSIAYAIKKEEKKWWDRLLKQEGKPPAFIKVDWDKWVDEEDENEQTLANLGDKYPTKGSKRKNRRKGQKNPLQQWLRRLNCLGKQ